MSTLVHGGWGRLILSWLRPRSLAGVPTLTSAGGRGLEWSRAAQPSTPAGSDGAGRQSRRAAQQLFREKRDFAERVNDFLRARYPRTTKLAHDVERDTGVPAATVAQWLIRGSAPSAPVYAWLAIKYGPDFLTATFASSPPWLDAAAAAEEDRRIREELQRITERLDRRLK